jgi:arylsulfatase A-like enzyme
MNKDRIHNTVTRRDFIKTSAIATVGINLVGCGVRTEKPNLLFIWTDQQRADTMKVYGNHKIDVPNFNKLAGQSIVFENAYVTQPVCTPSRSSVMTGLWPHTNGCTENNIPLRSDTPCLPEIINDPDYRTGYFGKWHLGDEVFAQHGFEEWESIEDQYSDYFSEGKDRSKVSSYSDYLLSLGYSPDGEGREFSRMFAAGLPLEHCKPKFLEQKACDFLKRHRNNPFILSVNFLEPHPPYTGPFNNKYDPMEIDMPLNFSHEPGEDEPLRYRLLRQKVAVDGYRNEEYKTENDWSRLVSRYWGLVSQVDMSVGVILSTLDNLGLAENTIVIFTSDHGEMLGSFRLLQKTYMYEESVKVPWLMRIPRYDHGFVKFAQPVCQIDLLPTMLDAMGVSGKDFLQGKSLIPCMRGDQPFDEDVYIEWNTRKREPDEYPPLAGVTDEDIQRANRAHIRTVVTREGWKLCWSDLDRSQLFDLSSDPHEKTNLYYSGRHDDKIRELKQKIEEWQQTSGDPVALEL